MSSNIEKDQSRRTSPLEMNPKEFRKLGHHLVDQIADFLADLPQKRVTTGEKPSTIRKILGDASLSDEGIESQMLLDEAAGLLINHSLFNGHPRFLGYITSSPAPIGVLGDLLASAVNPNVGAWILSPMASEIEAQTIRWLAELIGYPDNCGGVLVSGGNMANFLGFLAGRKAKAPWDIRSKGFPDGCKKLRVYASKETHTWIEKATDLFGLGTEAICWIPAKKDQKIDVRILEQRILEDREAGYLPIMVVGAAGTVSTGAIDPLPEIAAICHKYDLWFHVDGAYGAAAAVLPEASDDLKGLSEADSVALDPHKWLYSPLEAGCTLVRDAKLLRDAFSYHPEYYHFGGKGQEVPTNYYEYGLQNSRGFRSLKVWLALRQVGRNGYIKMIRDDIDLAQALYKAVDNHPRLEALTCNLSVTTFRFVPDDLPKGFCRIESYLNELNEELLDRLQTGGDVFVSNAMVDGKYALRSCIVNFRTSLSDVKAIPGIVARIGEEVDKEIRPEALKEI